jgi:hypothetical protein
MKHYARIRPVGAGRHPAGCPQAPSVSRRVQTQLRSEEGWRQWPEKLGHISKPSFDTMLEIIWTEWIIILRCNGDYI